ncbi:MAG TPA: gliding motility-associated C-terminal domain-containing protein [Flavobacteriales bacterium]|nr:gliding motility-associated C-terminal domain-containing protein [Flavobacteriales bacterium]
MFQVRPFLFCLLFAVGGGLAAQPPAPNGDCGAAVGICAGQPMAGYNDGAINTLPAYCQPGGLMVWYTFTTNSVGGDATATLDGLACTTSVPGMGNALSMVFLAGDGSCDPASFQQISECASDSMAFAVSTTQPLMPNTQYWLVVGGMRNNGATFPAECAFNITVSGPGVDVIGVDFSAGPDVTIAEGASTQLQATGGTTYEWNPTSGLSGNTVPDPVAQPGETTAYTVTTEINGCTFTDTVIVEVKQLVNPVNTFTPNGDGINDVWEIPELRSFPQAEVSVYDRWGQRVYHSIGYKDPFDGAGLPTATYYWYIQVNDAKGKSDPYTGYVTIIR